MITDNWGKYEGDGDKWKHFRKNGRRRILHQMPNYFAQFREAFHLKAPFSLLSIFLKTLSSLHK